MLLHPSPLRAVVDTNVIVRGTLSATGASALIIEAIKRRRCVLVSSSFHLAEVARVLARPRMNRRYGITDRRRRRLIARLSASAALVSTLGYLHICRDPQDDYLIELALADIRALLHQSGVRLVHVEGLLLDLARTASQG